MDSPGVKDVALLAGVSLGTVSNVLNRPDKVSPGTITKVTTAIAQLGYVRNDAARQLRNGRSRSLGLVVFDASNPFFTDLARGAERAAREHGYSVLLANSDGDVSREADFLELFAEQRAAGVLVSPIGKVGSRLQNLQRHHIPTVLVDRPSDRFSVSSVAVDDIAGGELAVQHLLATGRRRIAFVGGPRSIRQVAERLQGAQRAVSACAGAVLEEIPTSALTVLEGQSAAAAIISRPAPARPDAIFAANDLVAIGILQSLMLVGTDIVPHDIALIGYDDIEFARSSVVSLSSVRQPSGLLGETGVRLLLKQAQDRSAEPENIVFSPELVARESTSV